MRNKLGWLAIGLCIPLLIAATGGFPSRPRFQSVGVGTTAPAGVGNLAVTGTITGATNLPALSSANTFTGTPTIFDANTTTDIRVQDGSAAADNRIFRIRKSGNQTQLGVVNDALSVATNFLTAQQSGTTVTSIALTATDITANGRTILPDFICPTTGGCDISGLAVGQSALIIKGGFTDRSSTVTPTEDPDLSFTNLNNAHTHAFEYCVNFTNITTNTQGIRFEWGQSAGGSGSGRINGVSDMVVGGVAYAASADVQFGIATGGAISGSSNGMCGSGWWDSNNATGGLMWAQSMSNANATRVLGGAGSWIRITRRS